MSEPERVGPTIEDLVAFWEREREEHRGGGRLGVRPGACRAPGCRRRQRHVTGLCRGCRGERKWEVEARR